LAMRRVSKRFAEVLITFVDFLLQFEETPRSKFAKKYMPPMDILQEETSSMYAETVRTGSIRNKSHHPSRIMLSSNYSQHHESVHTMNEAPNFGGNYPQRDASIKSIRHHKNEGSQVSHHHPSQKFVKTELESSDNINKPQRPA
jgi:hypothetical protein